MVGGGGAGGGGGDVKKSEDAKTTLSAKIRLVKKKKKSYVLSSSSKDETKCAGSGGESVASSGSDDGPRVVKEGWLQKRGEHIKNWRSRYFVLMDDGSLRGYKGKNQLQPLNNFTVKGCDIMMTSRPKPFTFLVRGLHHTAVVERMFHVKTAQERENWVSAIKSVALKFSSELGKPEPPSCSISKILELELYSSAEEQTTGRVLGSGPATTALHSKSCEDLTAKFELQGVSESLSGRTKTTLENFEFLKVLGRGTFGKVILCREKTTSEFYALKVLKKSEIIETNEVGHTLTENRVLGKTRHPFLISLKCSFQTESNLCYVMEYANGGDLFYHLSTARFFTEERTRFYGAEVVEAIGYLHSFGIIYRDLKLENLLLDKDGHVKVADFGLCKEDITYGRTTRTFCGTPEYIAPEIIEDRDYGAAVDWWGVGIIVYEMMCGRLPFYSADHEELFMMILAEDVKFPPTFSAQAVDMLRGLLDKDPLLRLGGGPSDAKDVKDHPFFASVDWDDLYDRKIKPPFKPEVDSATDTRYFDSEFTGASVELTPPKKKSYCSDELDDIYEEDEPFNDFCYQEFSHNDFIKYAG